MHQGSPDSIEWPNVSLWQPEQTAIPLDREKTTLMILNAMQVLRWCDVRGEVWIFLWFHLPIHILYDHLIEEIFCLMVEMERREHWSLGRLDWIAECFLAILSAMWEKDMRTAAFSGSGQQQRQYLLKFDMAYQWFIYYNNNTLSSQSLAYQDLLINVKLIIQTSKQIVSCQVCLYSPHLLVDNKPKFGWLTRSKRC